MDTRNKLDVSITQMLSKRIFRLRPMPRSSGLVVLEYGQQRVSSQIRDRSLPCYAAVLVIKGNGALTTCSAGPLPVSSPALFWLVPGEKHSYGPEHGQSWAERWLLFAGTMAAEFEKSGLIDRHSPVVPLANPTKVEHMLATMQRDIAGHGKLDGYSAAATLHGLVIEVARQARLAESGRPETSSDDIADAIQRQAFDHIDFAGLARHFGISPATLRRRCVATLGMSPKAYQLQLRLARAKELLALTDDAVEAIALACGYDDPFYFSRVFRNAEGSSPTEFRRAHLRR